MPDWKRTDVTHQLEAVMISQTNFSKNLGLLEGVVWEQSTLEAAYYTDLRTSGKLRVCGEGWRRGSFIRIVHNIPEFNYRKTLGTYIVTDDSAEYKNGKWFYNLTLQSTLAMLSEDRFVKPYPIDKGTKAVDAMKAVLQNSGAHSMRTAFGNFSGAEAKSQVAIDDSLADDVRATKAQVLEAGKSRLEAFFALSSMSNNRIDVTPEGYIRVTRYTPPANKSATWTFDLREDRGTVVNGSLSRSSDWLSIPDTVAVRHDYSTDEKTGETYKKSGTRADGTTYKAGDPKIETKQHSIYAYAKTPNGPHSIARRGYSVVDFQQVSSISPHTLKAASDYAVKALKSKVELVEWELDTTYLPLWEGDVVNLVVVDGYTDYRGTRKCLVKNVDIDLGTMMMSVTLKETASGDEE